MTPETSTSAREGAPVRDRAAESRLGALWTFAHSEWVELGPVGRTVFVALVMSAVVAMVLGVAIPYRVEQYLVDGQIRSLSRVAGEMAHDGLIPPPQGDIDAFGRLDDAVQHNLLGADTVRVKIWLPDGTVAYSDEPALVGAVFPLVESELMDAFAGSPRAAVPDLGRPENAYERGMPPLREYYVPVQGPNGEVVAVFEVYQLAEPLDRTVGAIRRYTWSAIGLGIGLLAAFIATLVVRNGRSLVRGRRHAERLFGDLVRAQTEERRRIIGALHDDIGQTLYRLHYGIEDCRSRLADGGPSEEELEHLGALVREIDGALRAELRSLRYGSGEELSLGSALDELAEVTEMESDLRVDVRLDGECHLASVGRVALFRAAREAVTNVRKHARASRVTIRVDRVGGAVRLEVRDDGVGIRAVPGLGLTTTRERLEAIGGGLDVRRAPGGGTVLHAWVPAAVAEETT